MLKIFVKNFQFFFMVTLCINSNNYFNTTNALKYMNYMIVKNTLKL